MFCGKLNYTNQNVFFLFLNPNVFMSEEHSTRSCSVRIITVCTSLTRISLTSLLWDIGKQYSPRCDAAERGVLSWAILFAQRNFLEK